jgi:AraC-like DNA-binding protein
MNINTIDRIPSTSSIAAYIDNIAVFDSLNEVKGLMLPAKIDFILSILCEKGSLTISYDSVTRTMTERMLMVMKPGHVLQKYKASDDFRGHFIVVGTKLLGNTIPALSKVLPCFFHYKDNPIITLNQEDMASQTELRTLLKHKAYNNGHIHSGAVVHALLEALFYETLGMYSKYSPVEATPPSMRRRDSLLYSFIKAVEEHFREERSVAFYADYLCVTPKHLSATVKEASGRTAGEWIDSFVIIEAKMLLRNTGLTVQEVSTQLNFPNQSFFGKYFKHLTGISPREYRSNLPR